MCVYKSSRSFCVVANILIMACSILVGFLLWILFCTLYSFLCVCVIICCNPRQNTAYDLLQMWRRWVRDEWEHPWGRWVRDGREMTVSERCRLRRWVRDAKMKADEWDLVYRRWVQRWARDVKDLPHTSHSSPSQLSLYHLLTSYLSLHLSLISFTSLTNLLITSLTHLLHIYPLISFTSLTHDPSHLSPISRLSKPTWHGILYTLQEYTCIFLVTIPT